MLEPLKMRKNRLKKMLKKLLCYNKIVTTEELLSFIDGRKNEVRRLENSRNKIYNKLRGTKDTNKIEELKAERDIISAEIKLYRREGFLAGDILERQEKVREQIRKNQELKMKRLGLDKEQQKTNREWER